MPVSARVWSQVTSIAASLDLDVADLAADTDTDASDTDAFDTDAFDIEQDRTS